MSPTQLTLRAFALVSLVLATACGGDEGTKDNPDTSECTAGTTGCQCLADNTCSDDSDSCEDNVCAPRTDCTGELGCACDGTSCDDGLTCSNNVCSAGNAVLLTLSGGDARACDILVNTTGRKVAEVTYPAGVRGKMRTRDLSTAVALIRTTDTALSGVVAAIVFEGDDPVADGEAGVATTHCYDRTGAAASGVTVTAN